MAKTIYKMFQTKATEAWYQLSKEERDALMSKVSESLKSVGAKSVLTCASLWSSEQYVIFGVEEYPDIEAVQKHNQIYGISTGSDTLKAQAPWEQSWGNDKPLGSFNIQIRALIQAAAAVFLLLPSCFQCAMRRRHPRASINPELIHARQPVCRRDRHHA